MKQGKDTNVLPSFFISKKSKFSQKNIKKPFTNHGIRDIMYMKDEITHQQKGSKTMKIRWTNYRKDAASYNPTGSSEMEIEPELLQKFVEVLGFAITNRYRPDCYWKTTSYNTAEMIQVLEG